MRYRVIIPLLAAIALFISGCTRGKAVSGPVRGVEEYIEKTIPVSGQARFEVEIESGNIEVYTWKKDEVKFEITKRIRGMENEDSLKEKLGDFGIDIKENGNVVSVKDFYRGTAKNSSDINIGLRMYIPRKPGLFDCNLKMGKIVFFDDIRCNISIAVNMADVSINRMIGKLSLQADMCNLKISEGRILDGSSVKINMGNIYVKSEFEENGVYLFDTGMGNLEINLPEDSKVAFECVGSVEIDEVSKVNEGNRPQEAGQDAKVSLRSGMGRITVRRY